MSVLHTNNITNRDGTSGPTIAGITTVNSTGFMRLPVGDTFRRSVIENVVTDGLVLYLDAGNDISYPGNGTTWTDLSGENYNFTLINGPTFNSSNGGGIEQDGSNDYIERTYTPALAFDGNTSFTLQIVATTKTLRHNLVYPAIASNGDGDGGGGWEVSMYDDNNVYGGPFGSINFFRYQTGGSYISAGGGVGYLFTSLSDANSTNFWCYTYSSTEGGKLYRNGNLITSNATTGSITRSTTPNVFLGRRGSYANRVTSCIFYQFSVYNRALTATEVLQNYNAIKGRYL